jgi:peroxiredoxin Q/BCP
METIMKMLSIAVATALIAVPTHAALSPGAKAPALKTRAAMAGKPFDFNLAQALKKGPVVLYFYPAAFTQGCTLEAHEFADKSAEFNKAGATVVGVSSDDIATLTRFSREACRDKFAVAVGTPQTIAAYDVKLGNGMRSNRTSYVIARNGTIAYAYTASDYRDHVKNTLAAVQGMRGKR